MSLAQQIKERLGVLEYAKALIPIQNNRGVSLIEPGSNQTACAYYEQWFYDFKKCIGGDIIDLIAITKYNGDKGASMRALAEQLNLVKDNKSEHWIKETQNLCNYTQRCHEALSPEHKEYLLKRRISEETINRLKLGTDHYNRLFIPYWKNNYVCYYITRGENPKYKKALLTDWNENTGWGLHTLSRNKERLYICEGAFDAITLDQENCCVIASMGGFFNKTQFAYIKDTCKMYKEIILAFDSDDAGKLFTKVLAEKLVEAQIPFRVIASYDEHKDLSAYYEAGGDIKELEFKNGYAYVFETMKDINEIKSFVRSVGRFLDKIEMGDFYRHAKETLIVDPEILKEIFTDAMKCPSEQCLVRNILDDYILKYHEALGFFEYDGGKWHTVQETQVRKYIADALGKYKTGAKINSVLSVLQTDILYKDIFNLQPYVNFQNGVLELATGELKPHSPSYMMTHQMPYDYDVHEICPQWQKFILEVSNGDEQKALLLQEICGYIMFTNNSLQKAFFLLGDGANGKSVFLNMLSEIFPKESITHIEMSGLAEPFQRIQLANSFLNIASEARTSFEDAETTFKQAVVGDAINGCFKNKDFVAFVPRTKFFTACNKFISSKDTTEGFLRRLMFIKFSVKFVEDPQRELERKADKDIHQKLITERTGIFNWCYEGYKILKQNMRFTELPEHAAIINDYMNLIDPLFAFLRETMESKGENILFIDRDTLYDSYKLWCYDTTHMPQSRNKFLQNLRYTSHLRSIRIYEQSKSGRRGFVLEKVG